MPGEKFHSHIWVLSVEETFHVRERKWSEIIKKMRCVLIKLYILFPDTKSPSLILIIIPGEFKERL